MATASAPPNTATTTRTSRRPCPALALKRRRMRIDTSFRAGRSRARSRRRFIGSAPDDVVLQMGDVHRGRTAGLAQKRRNVAAVLKLPAAVLPAASWRAGSGVNTSAPMPAVMFTPHVPEHAPATVAVTTAPALL